MPSAEFDSARIARLEEQDGLEPIEFTLFGQVWRCVPMVPLGAVGRLSDLPEIPERDASTFRRVMLEVTVDLLSFIRAAIQPSQHEAWDAAVASNPLDVETPFDVVNYLAEQFSQRIDDATAEAEPALDPVTARQLALEGRLPAPEPAGDPRIAHLVAAGGEIG